MCNRRRKNKHSNHSAGRADSALVAKLKRRLASQLKFSAVVLVAALVFFACVPSATAQRGELNGRGNVAARPGDARPAVPRPGDLDPQRPQPAAKNAFFEAPKGMNVDEMLSPGGMPSTLKTMLLLTVLSLAPSILIMTTCFIRFIIVIGLLRQALGTQQLPPNQVITSLCLFLTFLVMSPVWKQAYEEGIKPYTDEQPIPGLVDHPERSKLEQTFVNTVRPLRKFMSDQIEATGNSDSVWMFLEYQNRNAGENAPPLEEKYKTYEDVPLSALLPAYMLSELKTAFTIGFQIYLPFLVIDMVVSSVLISMGMMMLPPVLISLPFKLLLFVLIDGWFLTVGMLLESVKPYS